MKYKSENLKWGCELEFGDIPRWVDIPEHLGAWEYYETDIVNQNKPYWGIASDPYGIDPPFGGEINTVPTKTWMEQVKIAGELITYFTNLGYKPTTSCVQQLHIHVSFEDYIVRDMYAMKNLLGYIRDNQYDFIEKTSQFVYDERMNESAVEFLRDDGGRLAPKSMYNTMIKEAIRYPKFLNYDQTEQDGLYLKRFGINLKSLQYGCTLEFRSFRSTIDLREIFDSFRLSENFVLMALNNSSESFLDYYNKSNYKLPKFVYDHELFTSWQKTKKEKRTDIKTRPFIPFKQI